MLITALVLNPGVAWAQLAPVVNPNQIPTACSPDTIGGVDRAMDALWKAFEFVDEDEFDRASKGLYAAISCLDALPPPTMLGRLHETMGLSSFVNGQARACRRSLATARMMNPGLRPNERLFPEGHPYLDLLAAANDPGPVQNIGRIPPAEWIVDGYAREDAPIDRAFLLQIRDEGRIVWTGYIWDWDEIPDRGQSRKRSALEPANRLAIALAAHGGALKSTQTVEVDTVWNEQGGTTFAGGTDLTVRILPITVVGFEVAGSITGPADPVQGGGGLPSGQAMLLLGGAGWTGGVQPHISARVGGGVDRMRNWVNGEEGPEIALWTVPSVVAGLEAGVRDDRHRVAILGEGRLGVLPVGLRFRVDGGVRVSKPFAVEGLAEIRTGRLSYFDTDGTLVGNRSDLDLRLGAAIALWLL